MSVAMTKQSFVGLHQEEEEEIEGECWIIPPFFSPRVGTFSRYNFPENTVKTNLQYVPHAEEEWEDQSYYKIRIRPLSLEDQ